MCKPNRNLASFVLSVIAPLLLSGGYVHADEVADQPATDTGQTVYKKVGPGGEIIYSDKPSPESEEVKVLPPASNYKPVTPPTSFTPYQPPPNTPATKAIDNSVTITAPKNEETIWSAPGEFTVSVSLASALAPNQQLNYLIDGATVLSGSETSHTFSNIDRGAHVLTVQIVDKSGNTVTSPPVTFYLQRPTKKR